MNTHVHNTADVKKEKGKKKNSDKLQRQFSVTRGNSFPGRPEEPFLAATTPALACFGATCLNPTR